MRLVLATRNAHKLRELEPLMRPHELVPLPEDVELPPETGETFAENALAKARAAAAATGLAAVADDSGIAAAALNGGPGVRSARFAGEHATDEENLAKLLREVPAGGDRRVAYVCALAFADPSGEEHVVEGRCEGTLAMEPRGTGGFGYDPAFLPDDYGDGRTMAELEPQEKDAISHRGRAARKLTAWLADRRPGPIAAEPHPPGAPVEVEASTDSPRKVRAAALSIASNTTLIVLKLIAGAVTGSIAIITEAIHSSVDLLASVIAYFSVRKADEPADADHPYGHAKLENLAAVIEGMLVVVGAGIIIFESVRRLIDVPQVEQLGFGIAVIALSTVANLAVSTYLYRQARITESPALEGDAAHLRTDAMTSAAVLVGLTLVEATGVEQLDSLTALLVAGAIVVAGVRILTRSSRVLVDEALPEPELDAIREVIEEFGADEVLDFHQLRARRAGSRRYVDLHLQFRHGTSLERAHELAHQIQGEIRRRLRGADVLIHLEPEESVRPRARLRSKSSFR
jgi:non-canonical purine NTP pyrophosphatase (RdgB/HAM1 family)